VHVTIDGPAGPLEGLLDVAPGRGSDETTLSPVRAAVVFGHPHPQHGGTMHTKAVYQGAKGLARIGCAVLRFNFRGVGLSAGSFDQGRGETADYAAAVDFMHARYPGTQIWTAGFSFGSWIALEPGSVDDRVSALIGVAPPVARSGYAFPKTLETQKPKFLIQGDLDELCPLQDLWAFYARLRDPKELAVIDGGTHLFEGKTREVGDALEDLLGDFE
jgi:alpha/beta superfamily hydrolase